MEYEGNVILNISFEILGEEGLHKPRFLIE